MSKLETPLIFIGALIIAGTGLYFVALFADTVSKVGSQLVK